MGESDKLLERHIFTITVQSPLSCFITVLGVCCVLIVPAVMLYLHFLWYLIINFKTVLYLFSVTLLYYYYLVNPHWLPQWTK